MLRKLASISALCNDWVERSLAVMGIALALIVAAQVFFRFALNSSLFWSEELARYLLVWLTFLGASSAYFRGIHPGIDVLTAHLSGPWHRLCRTLVHLVSLTLFIVMIYHGSLFAHFVRAQITPALALPKWIVFSVIPLSGTLFLLHCLVFLCSDLAEDGRDH